MWFTMQQLKLANNRIEAQNKALKYKFLPRTSISLSNVVTIIIIEQFLPEQNRNYLFLNFQMDPTYRGYSSEVPTGHPKNNNIIVHCLSREEKARKTFSEDSYISVNLMNFYCQREVLRKTKLYLSRLDQTQYTMQSTDIFHWDGHLFLKVTYKVLIFLVIAMLLKVSKGHWIRHLHLLIMLKIVQKIVLLTCYPIR